MVELAAAFLACVAIGAASGIPLGVLNTAVVEAAVRRGRAHATGIALGGALADGVHAALAFLGVAPFLLDDPALARPLALASAALLLLYAATVHCTVTPPATVHCTVDAPATVHGTVGRGVAVGLVLTLPNPAPLVAWVAVAGAVMTEASVAQGIVGAVGVTIGSAAWFVLLARWASRGTLGARAARWLPRVAAVTLVAIALAGVARVLL